jgi:hypothetical protein
MQRAALLSIVCDSGVACVHPAFFSFFHVSYGDRLGAVMTLERLIERVAVVGFVANELGRGFIEKTYGKNFFHKLGFGDYVRWTDTARGKPLPAAIPTISAPRHDG